jgi:hypothetical protein
MELMEWHSGKLLEQGEKVLREISSYDAIVEGTPQHDGVYLMALLNGIHLHRDFVSYLKCINKKKIIYLHCAIDEVFDPFCLGHYIEILGGITKSLKGTEALIEYRHGQLLESKNQWFENDPIWLYLRTIVTLIDLAFELIARKRRGKGDKKLTGERIDKLPWEQEFCSLCWRIVRKSREKKDTYYCQKHHSSKNKHAHQKLTRELEKVFSINHPDSKKFPRGDKARWYEHTLMGLARKLESFEVLGSNYFQPHGSEHLESLINSKTKWTIAAKILLIIIKPYYPDTYDRVNGTIDIHESWRDWVINGVIKKLCDRYETEEHLLWQEDCTLTEPCNWRIILHVFRRFQASQNLENSIKYVGRKSKVPEVIKYMRELQQEGKQIPTKAELSRLTEVSPPTVDKAWREFYSTETKK